jgi:hypothetical protein
MLKKIYKSLKAHWKAKKLPLCWVWHIFGKEVPKSLQGFIGFAQTSDYYDDSNKGDISIAIVAVDTTHSAVSNVKNGLSNLGYTNKTVYGTSSINSTTLSNHDIIIEARGTASSTDNNTIADYAKNNGIPIIASLTGGANGEMSYSLAINGLRLFNTMNAKDGRNYFYPTKEHPIVYPFFDLNTNYQPYTSDNWATIGRLSSSAGTTIARLLHQSSPDENSEEATIQLLEKGEQNLDNETFSARVSFLSFLYGTLSTNGESVLDRLILWSVGREYSENTTNFFQFF